MGLLLNVGLNFEPVETEPNKLIICQMFYPEHRALLSTGGQKDHQGFLLISERRQWRWTEIFFPPLGVKRDSSRGLSKDYRTGLHPTLIDSYCLLEKQQKKFQQKIIQLCEFSGQQFVVMTTCREHQSWQWRRTGVNFWSPSHQSRHLFVLPADVGGGINNHNKPLSDNFTDILTLLKNSFYNCRMLGSGLLAWVWLL